jgi:hypothetical protein
MTAKTEPSSYGARGHPSTCSSCWPSERLSGLPSGGSSASPRPNTDSGTRTSRFPIRAERHVSGGTVLVRGIRWSA